MVRQQGGILRKIVDTTASQREEPESRDRVGNDYDHNSNVNRLGHPHQKWDRNPQCHCSNEEHDWNCAENDTGMNVNRSSEIIFIHPSTLECHSIVARYYCRVQ